MELAGIFFVFGLALTVGGWFMAVRAVPPWMMQGQEAPIFTAAAVTVIGLICFSTAVFL